MSYKNFHCFNISMGGIVLKTVMNKDSVLCLMSSMNKKNSNKNFSRYIFVNFLLDYSFNEVSPNNKLIVHKSDFCH